MVNESGEGIAAFVAILKAKKIVQQKNVKPRMKIRKGAQLIVQ